MSYRAGDMNLYRYVTNSPTSHNDPLGLRAAPDTFVEFLDKVLIGFDQLFSPPCYQPNTFQCNNCNDEQSKYARALMIAAGIQYADDAGGGNAFQHCYVSCQSVKACGFRCAAQYWTDREKPGEPGKPFAPDALMDLENNTMGFLSAKDSRKDCWDSCKDKWDSGQLVCLNDQKKQMKCPPSGK